MFGRDSIGTTWTVKRAFDVAPGDVVAIPGVNDTVDVFEVGLVYEIGDDTEVHDVDGFERFTTSNGNGVMVRA